MEALRQDIESLIEKCKKTMGTIVAHDNPAMWNFYQTKLIVFELVLELIDKHMQLERLP